MASKFRIELLDRAFLESNFVPEGDRIASLDYGRKFGRTEKRRGIVLEGPVDYGAFALVDVHCTDLGVRANPPGPPGPSRGVAMLEDGTRFVLGDPEEMDRFYARVRGAITPRDLARLLVEFHTEGGHILVETERERRLVRERVPDLVFPPILEDDPLHLEFCSLRWDASLHRWSVRDEGGHLECSCRTIWERVRSR